MAPKPPPKAKAAKNKEPASSSETKTDSARSEQKAAKPSSAGAAKEKKKEKEKKKVKKAEELPRTEVSLEIIPESAEGPMAREPAEEVAAPEPPAPANDDTDLRSRLQSKGLQTGHHLHLPFQDLLRHLLPHLAASSAPNSLRRYAKLWFLKNLAASLLCRAWKRTHEIRCKLIEEGKLAVILVANLGTGVKLGKGGAEVRQKHIHTTVNHAGQRATFLIANEYGWGSESGPGGKDDVQEKLGLTLTTRLPTETPPTLHGSPSSCWCYAEQEQVSGRLVSSRAGLRSQVSRKSKPGYELTSCQNFIATRHSFGCCPPDPSSEILHPGAFLLEKMSKNFYEVVGLPAQAYDGRFVCCKAKWVDNRYVDWPHAGAAAAAERQPSHFLLATWHGPHWKGGQKEKAEQKEKADELKGLKKLCLKKLCERLRDTCDASAGCLGCVLAGDFNLDLHELELADYVGFRRLDPDENVRRDGCRTERPHPHRRLKQEVAQWAGRRSFAKQKDGTVIRVPQHDVDHMLFYRPEGSPLEARRPRRFRMYDRRREGLLPKRSLVTHKHDGALDHDGLILELWLDAD